MVALNFQPGFALMVESGAKPHTFRVEGKRRPPRVGETLSLYTGMRSKACRLLKRVTCTRVQPMTVGLDSGDPFQSACRVHDVEISVRARERFARRDGFASWAAFVAWVRKTHKPGKDGIVRGYLIWWGGPAP
jgi:hypothetical protein